MTIVMEESTNKRLLDVLIATHGDDGLECVAKMTLPKVEGVNYIVTWQTQNPRETPQALCRPDLQVHVIDSIGTSNNHNAGMELAEASYCLFADNDLHYTTEGLKAVIDAFETHPEVDVATFRHSGDNTNYPEYETEFTTYEPRGYNVALIDIAYRRNSIGDIRFDPNFGICAPLAGGEDQLFKFDCCRAGLTCRFFPITIVHHPGLSSGFRRISNPRAAMAEGAYIRVAYGITGYPRVPLFAWRAYRSGRMSLLWGLWHLTRGFFSKYAMRHRKKH